MAEWYDDNEARDYPFLAAPQATSADLSALPHSSIVDAGFWLSPRSGFDASRHQVWLASVSREGDQLLFEFRTNAAAAATDVLLFQRAVTDPKYTHEQAVARLAGVATDSISASDPCDESQPLWDGFLVTGDLTELAALLSSGQRWAGHLTVEPATTYPATKLGVHTLSVANGDRTRAETADGCRDLCWPVAPQDVFVRGRCLTGPIRFVAGYNLAIRQDAATNALIFEAAQGAGQGEVCAEVQVIDNEAPPQGRLRLDGSLGCHEVFRGFNGLAGPVVPLTAGAGVRLTFRPEQSKIIVDVSLQDLAICYAGDEHSQSLTDPPDNVDPCDCGPA